MTKHFDTEFKVPDTRTCRDRQDDAITKMAGQIDLLNDVSQFILGELTSIRSRLAVLEAKPAGTVIWDTGAVTWDECYTPKFAHSPGYPAPEEAT